MGAKLGMGTMDNPTMAVDFDRAYTVVRQAAEGLASRFNRPASPLSGGDLDLLRDAVRDVLNGTQEMRRIAYICAENARARARAARGR